MSQHHHRQHHTASSKSLPLVANLKHTGPGAAKKIIEHDRERARKLLAGLHPHGPLIRHDARAKEHFHRSRRQTSAAAAAANDPDSIDVSDAAVSYNASVGVGSPATAYSLLIDTGSSNTWLGADKKYVVTKTSKKTNATVQVSYGSGSFSGKEYTDQVTLGPELVIKNQSIGVASTAQGFEGVDGILGIGPVDLTEGTLSTGGEVPTVTDNLFKQGIISSESIGILFAPTTASPDSPDSPGVMNGELTFGGTDTSETTGEVHFVPITSTSPASSYWGVNQSVSYGNTTILDETAGIVDTGTTLILIATDAFQKYQEATGATLDQSTGLLTITEEQYDNLQELIFNIGGIAYDLIPNAQIWPRSLNSTIGGEEGKIYLVVSDLGSPSGQGLDFIDGFGFLQRFYSVFDTGNAQVGLAPTRFTDADTN